jgi:hypothetical protein
MIEPLIPRRGGFIKPFGCGWFIRECLLGHRPEGSPKIDPRKGACQQDLFYYYKIALHRAYAQDAVDYENEQRLRQSQPIYNEEEYRARVDYFMSRMPYKLVKCRYHSFSRYFHMLKQLGWVEFTGREEPASIQENYPYAPSRRYYRLTIKGTAASDREWSNPQITLHPERGLKYYRQNRKLHKYSQRKPTKRRQIPPAITGF